MSETPGDWNRVKELFEAALDLEPPQRAAFLARNCGDDRTREQVERLLRNYQAAGNFLDEPALSRLAQPQTAEESPGLQADSTALTTATSVEIEDPMAGRRLGAYKLVKRIGQGGMAAVFLAVRADAEYQKEVAIKLVQPGQDSRDLLNRFRNERQTLAGLDHPNIVKLLDGGSTPEGLPFLVMDYVEGLPIDDYSDRHKLCIDERLHLFGKVCQAVQYAHQKLVVHRDLKPSNILVTADGTPRLLDFGIAKVLNPQPSLQMLLVSQTGTRCMTPAYASPEQMRSKSITPATDIYSLGVVLYELLTGHRPYRLTQHTPAEMERAICEQDPETPSTAVSRGSADLVSKSAAFSLFSVDEPQSFKGETLRYDGAAKTPEVVRPTRKNQAEQLRRRLRGDLDNIVLKALQKESERRYGSAQELARDINRHLNQLPVTARASSLDYRASKFVQRHKTEVSTRVVGILVFAAAAAIFTLDAFRFREHVAGGTPIPRIQSLAVLPLANLSGDPAQEYFSDGITDALITELAQIGSLKVISRTSSMQYKQTKKSLPDIARELNVEGIVEGTVQRSGERVRITAQLVHASSDKHLWAGSLERDMRDIFALERDIAEAISDQVQAKLTTPTHAPLAQARPVSPRVLEAYLQGNYSLTRFGHGAGDEALRKAEAYFQQAIDADPGFAPAYVGIFNAIIILKWPSGLDDGIASKAAVRAVELDPNLAHARAILGVVKQSRDWDFRGAEQEYRRAIALSPNTAIVHTDLCFLLLWMGRRDEGLRECQISQQLDPAGDHMRDVDSLYIGRRRPCNCVGPDAGSS